ncbi:MFS transporter [Kibdelosporangium aridum]|uniref:MFS transporter n=1 Tax=Kibdelosporangium aridum TaxID=2030 RepID=A0A428ZHQ3_KIBAR|nr:MFS transporter [Kibdelosporangium aridum]RSM87490.1 MFS transporter [Kibdelosporangium aridum]
MPSTTRTRSVLGVLLIAVLAVFTGQYLLSAVLAPLSREIQLSEYHLGLVITVAAVAFTVASIGWGKLCDRWGTRRVLLTGLVIGAIGLGLFGAVCAWAVAGERATGLVLTAMIVTRSALFGIGLGAVSVAALAYAGASSSGEAERTRAMSLIAAAQASAQILGPGLGGLLALADLLAPVYLAPVLLLLAALVVAVLLPKPPAAERESAPAERIAFWDSRIRHYFPIGFLLFLSLGVVQIVIGFLFQDRLGLDARTTAAAIGVAGVLTGLVLIVMQAVAVPRLRWGPVRLLRVGAPVAAVGYVVLAFGSSYWSMIAGLIVVTLGLGLGLPGYTAGPGLAVGADQQGQVSGLINATNGLTYIVGPLLGTALYEVAPVVPVVFCVGLCAVAAMMLVATPAFQVGSR